MEKRQMIEVCRNVYGLEFEAIKILCKKIFPKRKLEAYSLQPDIESKTRYVLKYNLTMEEYNTLCKEWERQGIRIINGTFSHGCGVIVHDTITDKYFHTVILTDSNNREFIEINGKQYYKEDVIF